MSDILRKVVMKDEPRVTQNFGGNKKIYSQFGMEGHNGIDLGYRTGTPCYSYMPGEVTVKEDKNGYGLHVRVFYPSKKECEVEIIYAHLNKVFVSTGDVIKKYQKIGDIGNTGFSTGPHLHIGVRYWENGSVKDYNNGYYGYIDPLQFRDERYRNWALVSGITSDVSWTEEKYELVEALNLHTKHLISRYGIIEGNQ